MKNYTIASLSYVPDRNVAEALIVDRAAHTRYIASLNAGGGSNVLDVRDYETGGSVSEDVISSLLADSDFKKSIDILHVFAEQASAL